MRSTSPARPCEGLSWVGLVGSHTIHAVSVSASQTSRRPSKRRNSCQVMGTAVQPMNSSSDSAGSSERTAGRLPASDPLLSCNAVIPVSLRFGRAGIVGCAR